MKEGALAHTEASPTAATVGKPLFGPSGVIHYRVNMQFAGGGIQSTVVKAATGDDAAAKALVENPGAKVTYVGPAPKRNAD